MKIFKALGRLGILTVLFFGVLCFAEGGEVSILVYRGSKPAVGFSVSEGGKALGQTDANGYFSKSMASGVHTLTLEFKGSVKDVPVEVSEGENSQIIVNILNEDLQVESFSPERIAEDLPENGNLIPLKGVLKSSVDQSPIAGARVFVKGKSVSATTNGKGEFEIPLPEGEYELSFLHSKFTTKTSDKIQVSSKESAPSKFSMNPSGLELEDYLVLSPRMSGSVEALIEVRKNSANVADVISAEKISKTGDSDAAASLRRVTGLTLVDGKFVYIRGLGERYSSTLYNGVSLPSPDPSRRVVPLDLFPTSILDSLVIQKSYSPENSAEFGGGSIFLQSRSFPEEFFFSSSVGTKFHSLNSDTPLTYSGGSTDWLGVDDGTRGLPGDLTMDSPSTGDSLQKFKNIHNLKDRSKTAIPSLQLALGDGLKRGALKGSYVASLMYGDDYKESIEESHKYLSTGKESEGYDRNRYQRTIKTGGLLGLGLGWTKNHQLKFDYLLVRNTTNEASVKTGFNYEQEQIRDTYLEWTERQLQNGLLQGEHRIPRLFNSKIKWHVSRSEAKRYEPDRRSYRYRKNPDTGDYEFFGFEEVTSEAYQRRYTKLADNVVDYGSEWMLPFKLWSSPVYNEISVGFNQVYKNRNSQIRRYGLAEGTTKPSESSAKSTDDLETIMRTCQEESCLRFQDDTRSTDNYFANHHIQSYYMNTKWALTPSVNLHLGVRQEHSVQEVTSFALFTADATPTVSQLKTWDTLPAASATWKLTEKMQLRAAYSETVSRPDLKELSNTIWRDDEKGYDVKGEPNLKEAVINNYDFRWEWYFDRKDNVSAGVFYKKFRNPIESIFNGKSDPVLTFSNAEEANNLGFEFEWSQSLDSFYSRLNGFRFGANYSYIQSEVKLDNLNQSVLTSKERPLQGQSPYVVNGILEYEKENWGTSTSLVYNIFGPRISEVGTYEFEDIYENEFHQLDLVLVHLIHYTQLIKLRGHIATAQHCKT